MRHNWTTEDDLRLEREVTIASDSGIKRWKFWSAVAGRMLPEVVVTADAARSRWDRLIAARRETNSPANDRWAEVTARVEEFEKDQLDYLVEYVVGLQGMVRELDARVADVQAEQRRLRALWE